MENINLPPFYIGQRVVRIAHDIRGLVKKGKKYIVSEVGFCCTKWGWRLNLKEVPHKDESSCENCGKQGFLFAAKNFAPVEENFETVSYKEVIRKEKPLTCAN